MFTTAKTTEGLDFHIGLVADTIARDYAGLLHASQRPETDLLFLRQEIRKHIEDPKAEALGQGDTEDKALDNMVKIATAENFHIVNEHAVRQMSWTTIEQPEASPKEKATLKSRLPGFLSGILEKVLGKYAARLLPASETPKPAEKTWKNTSARGQLYNFNILEGRKQDFEELIYAGMTHDGICDYEDDILYRTLINKWIRTRKTGTGSVLVDKAFERKCWERGERFGSHDLEGIAQRIFYRELGKIMEGTDDISHAPIEKIEIKEFLKRYVTALTKAWAITGDTEKFGNLKNKLSTNGIGEETFKKYVQEFKAMYTPRAYFAQLFTGVRNLDVNLVDEESEKLTKCRENAFKTSKNPLDIVDEFAISMEYLTKTVLSAWVPGYNGSDEHIQMASDWIYYSRLDAISQDKQAKAHHKRTELQLLKEALEQKMGTTGGFTIEDGAPIDDFMQEDPEVARLKAEIKTRKKEIENALVVDNDDVSKAFYAALSEMDVLVGDKKNPMRRRDVANAVHDYRRQTSTEDLVFERIAGLYTEITLDYTDGQDNVVGITPVASESPEKQKAVERAKAIITSKVAHHRKSTYMTADAFEGVVADVVAELRADHLIDRVSDDKWADRARVYENAMIAIVEPMKLESIISAPRYPRKVEFDYLIQSACKYFQEGKISEGEALWAIQHLEFEELSQNLFDEVFDELNEKLEGRAPNMFGFESAFQLFEERRKLLMAEYPSGQVYLPSIVLAYLGGGDGKMPTIKGIEFFENKYNKKHDYNRWVRSQMGRWGKKGKAVEFGDVVDHLCDDQFVQMWKAKGESMPTPEDLYKARVNAVNIAKQTDKKFGHEPNAVADEKNVNRFYASHLKKYAAAVRNHKAELEKKHDIASKEVIEATFSANPFRRAAEQVFLGRMFNDSLYRVA